MIELDTRTRDILLLLLQADRPLSLESLTAYFQLSPRQVRYALKKAQPWLDSLEVGLRANVQDERWFDLPDALRTHLINRLKREQGFSTVLSAEERAQYELLRLLTNEEPVLLKQLAVELNVSYMTVSRDLDDVAQLLADRWLQFISHPNAGVTYEGAERTYRIALVDLLGDIIAPKLLLDILRSKGFHHPPDGGSLLVRTAWDYVRTLDLECAAHQVCKSLEDLHWADTDIVDIFLYLAIAIRRIRAGHIIEPADGQTLNLKDHRAFDTVSEWCDAISKTYHVTVPDQEVVSLAVRLASARVVQLSPSQADTIRALDNNEAQVQAVVQVITEISSQRLHPFLRIDPLLSRGLKLHFGPVLNRLHFGLSISNPVAEEVRLNYPEIYLVAEECREPVESIIGKPVPEAEVAFWTMHLGAALERLRTRPRRRVIVVCNQGIATAWLLVSRLRTSFPTLDIVDVISVYKLCEHGVDEKPLDAIISTVPLPFVTKQILIVSPLLGPQDKLTISSALGLEAQDVRIPREVESDDLPNLTELLPGRAIRLRAIAVDWVDVTQQAGALLVDQGVAEPRYIDAMIAIIQRHGPYMVFAPGVVLLHALPEEGALRLGMSLLVLRDAIPFGHKANDPVDVVFAFASIDARKQLRAFNELATLVNNPEMLHVLRHACESYQVHHLFSQVVESHRRIQVTNKA